MAIETGLAAQLGMATEGSYAAGATVTRFWPLISENVNQKINRIESKAIIAGRRSLDITQRQSGSVEIAGSIQTELYDRSQGILWSHIMGGAAITSTAGVAPYTQTYTMGDLSGKSFATQVGRPDKFGTVQPFSWVGCKVTKWQLACQAGQIATLGYDIVAQKEVTASSLASASYVANLYPMYFSEGVVTVSGSSTNVKSLTLNGDNKLDVKRMFLGTPYIAEPLEADVRDYTGSMDLEFDGLVQRARYLNLSTVPVVLTFTSGFGFTTTINMSVQFDDDSPNVKDRGVTQAPVKFKAVASSDASAFSVVTVNSDSIA